MFWSFIRIVGWAYRFSVMLTLACPRISERDFRSNPASMHLVAKV